MRTLAQLRKAMAGVHYNPTGLQKFLQEIDKERFKKKPQTSKEAEKLRKKGIEEGKTYYQQRPKAFSVGTGISEPYGVASQGG